MASMAHLGMDVHKGQFRMAVLPETGAAFADERTLPRERGEVLRYLRRWQPGYELQCYYEAGPLGYEPHRWLTQAGIACQVIAPSKTPRGPGDRVRTDARDARRLARQGRAGALVAVQVPTPEQEGVRDLVRCRMVQLWELTAARQRVVSLLGRHGGYYTEGSAWTQSHWRWLQQQVRAWPADSPEQWALHTYLAEVQYRTQRLAEAQQEVAGLAQLPAYREVVGRLGCFRGIDVLGAMLIACETLDFRRFTGAPQYASYWGLTGREESSGATRHRGGITKCGCAHLRWQWIQIAWHYQYPPAVGPALAKRQQGQPPEVIAVAWKAQRRLYRKFRKLKERMAPGKAVVAVARELTGFVWAAMTS